MNGQLYIVKTRGRLKECRSIEKCSYILASNNKDEVEAKLSYFVDLSVYVEFSIKAIERIKPNFHIVSRTVLSAEEHQAAKEGLHQVSDADQEGSTTLQPAGSHIFAFGCVGHVLAGSESAAIKKVSNFLARKSMGGNAQLPFASNGHFVIEAVGESDSTRTNDLSKFENFATGNVRMVQGGGTSPR